MPEFDLRDVIPGVEVAAPFTVPDAGSATVVVELADDLLRLAPTSLTATYDATAARLTLRHDPNPPLSLVGGQLRMDWLELNVRCAPGDAGVLSVDRGATAPVTAGGAVRWVGDVPKALGAPDDVLPFALSYSYTGAVPGRFELNLAAPVALSRVAVDLSEAAVGIDVLPSSQALVLSASGQAGLRLDVEGKVRGALEKVLGAGNAPDLTPPAFRLRQTLRMSDLDSVLDAIEPPRLSLLPSLGAGANPVLPSMPEGLDVVLGLPQFDFSFPRLGEIPDLQLLFRDCALRFPGFAGLEAFDLQGRLRVLTEASGAFRLQFEPSAPGGVTLPDVLRWLLARIAWLPALPDIADLPDLIVRTLSEVDWLAKFRALLPIDGGLVDAAFLATFRTAFDAIVTAAQALPRPLTLPDLFALAADALSSHADALFPEIVDAWFRLSGSTEQLRLLVTRLAASVPAAVDAFLAALFAHSALDLGGLLGELLVWGATKLSGALDEFLHVWVRVLQAGVSSIDPGRLARAIIDALSADNAALGAHITLGELPFLSGIPGLDMRIFRLPVGTALTGLGLSSLVLKCGLPTRPVAGVSLGAAVQELFSAVQQALESLLVPFRLPPIDATMVLRLIRALFSNAQGDAASELVLLQLARFPVLGMVLPLAAAVHHLATDPIPWHRRLWKPIEDDPALKVKRLPAPARGASTAQDVKYLIVSDIHRDALADRKPLFETGAIAHFLDNQQLYLDILDWADREHYTVLEAGDCEELWFIRDFGTYQGAAAHLQQVLDTHSAVYDKLAKLHQDGRYFRVYGNHDSQLREAAVGDLLRQRFQSGGRPFEIFDYLIVDGIKRMDEHGIAEIPGEVWNAARAPDKRVASLIEGLAEGRLGLDSEPYQARTRLVVTHGHQFDFWNCDEHGLVGKMIANGVGVPVDSLDDPLRDLGGIALAGSPLVDFQKALAALPVFSNFPAYNPSRAFAHGIQHMHDSDRVLVNDLFYLEAIPALVAAWALPVHLPDHRWDERTYDPTDDTFFAHFLNNAIAIGHTHYPQSRPYYDIAGVLAGPLKPVVEMVREAVAGLLFGIKPPINFLKAQYYNSGTAGWMQGVVWAIEIDASGQARLVFWTRDTRPDAPQEMDWELQRFDDAHRAALAAKRQEIAAEVEKWVERFAVVIAAAGVGAASLSTATLLALHDLVGVGAKIVLEEVDVAGGALAEAATSAQQAAARIGEAVVRVMLALAARQLPGAGEPQVIEVSVPLSPDAAVRLGELETILGGLPDVAANAVTHHAALWMAVSEQLPIVNGGPFRGALVGRFPVLWSVLSLLTVLPPGSVAVGEATLEAAVTAAAGRLSVTVTVSRRP